MKFISVEIKNFGTLSEAKVELSDRGLVLVQGENNHNPSADSNGAGKSTVFEAISWCLYGKTAKGQTGDAVINRKTKKNCSVSLLLDDDGIEYRISRGRKDNIYKSNVHVIRDNGTATDLTKGTDKLTQEVVEQVLGCSYEVFIGAVYAGQEKMPDLPSMTDGKLKVLIEEAAGITVLDQAYAIARQRMNDAKGALESWERDLDRCKQEKVQSDVRLDDAKASEQRWNAERDARVMDLETNAKILLRDAKSFKTQLESLKSEEDIETQRRLNKNKMDKRDSEESKLEELESLSHTSGVAAARIKSKAESQTSAIKRLREQLVDLKDHVGKPCTSCKRPHTEESLGASIKAKEKEISEAIVEVKDTIEEYKAASSDAQSASLKASEYKSSMTDMREAIQRSETLTEQLSNVKDVQTKYKSALTRAKDATQSIKDERINVNPYLEEIKVKEKTAADNKRIVKDKIKAMAPLTKAVSVAQSVVSVYSPKGVRAHILDTVTPYLNERTAHYLGALSDGEIKAIWQTITLTAKGEARENFKISVTGDDGSGSFVDLSGGEKRKVRVACSLALQDLVSTRASKSLGLFIADEIDDALDNAGLERLMGILEEKAKERGSVFIISHSDLTGWCSNVIVVQKDGGTSKVVS